MATAQPSQGIALYPLTWQLIGAAAFVMGAGVLHFVYAPVHLAAARGQGLFFLMLGFAQIGWGATALRLPSPRAYLVGMAFVTVMPAVLYAATRFIAPPFGDEAEGVDIIGAATFVGEAMGAILLAWHGIRQGIQWRGPDIRPGLLTTLLVLVGLAAAGGAFGVGLVLETAVPWLGEGEIGGHGVPSGDGGTGGHHSSSQPGPLSGSALSPSLLMPKPLQAS